MPRIDIEGISTHYQQQGAGEDVILIHAFTSNLAVWMLTPIVSVLADKYRVTTYDLRGHGLTAATPTGYSSADMVGDLRRLHRELELSPAFLVGHSFGGVIAMRAAWEHPELVRGVILSDTYFPGLSHLEPEMGQAEPWAELRTMFRQVDVDLGTDVDFSRLFRVIEGLSADALNSIKSDMGAAGSRWLLQMGQLAATSAGDEMFQVAGFTADKINQVRQPVVALYDEHSPFQATCDYLRDNLPDCRVDIVPGARHLAPVQNPEAFVALVDAHLARMTESTAS